MDFLDQFKNAGQKLLDSQMSNIGGYLEKQLLGSNALVKVGVNPGGNLSAAQQAAGMKPAIQTSVGQVQSQGFIGQYGMYLAIGAVAIGAIYFVTKK